jgi:hypothetical protein
MDTQSSPPNKETSGPGKRLLPADSGTHQDLCCADLPDVKLAAVLDGLRTIVFDVGCDRTSLER